MRFLTQNHSSYPTSPGASLASVIGEQEAAGCDVVTDGQLGWSDLLDGAAALDGVRLGPAGTPRQLQIVGEIQRRRPLIGDTYRQARQHTAQPLKAVLPGPYTLARRGAGSPGPYASLEALGHAFSLALAAEVDALAQAGAAFIQLEEPDILQHAEDIRLLRQLFEPVWAARGGAQIILATYDADATPLYAQLNSIPADVLALDLVSAPGLYDLIRATGASKVLALGIVDGRSATFAAAEDLAKRVAPILKRYEFEEIYLLPSCGLRSTTPAGARAALQQLHRACTVLQSRGRG